MPNIVYLWDFETGDAQGWTLGSYTTIDNTGFLQGTYCLLFNKSMGNGEEQLVASISGIDLSTLTKPLLIFIVRTYNKARETSEVISNQIIVRVKDSIGNVLISHPFWIADGNLWSLDLIDVVAVDLKSVAGQSNLTIEIWIRCNNYTHPNYVFAFDMIAIIDGVDYEYNTGIVTFDNEERLVEIAVPDSDLSGLNVDRFALSLVTVDWNYTRMYAQAVTDQASIKIDTQHNRYRDYHGDYVKPSVAPTLFDKMILYIRVNIGSYVGWEEKFIVVFFDPAWNYKRIYLFNVYYTANGISPRFISAVNTTTYGSTVSGSKDINVKIHGSKFSVALKVKYLVGDPSIVSVGSVKLTVYSSDKSTNYGSVTIDLTVASEQTSSYIDNLPTDTDLIFTIEWSITASARVVLLVVPLVKVS